MNIDINEELRKHLLEQQEKRLKRQQAAETIGQWLAFLGLAIAVAIAKWSWDILFG